MVFPLIASASKNDLLFQMRTPFLRNSVSIISEILLLKLVMPGNANLLMHPQINRISGNSSLIKYRWLKSTEYAMKTGLVTKIIILKM
jgi:hypothetical protein